MREIGNSYPGTISGSEDRIEVMRDQFESTINTTIHGVIIIASGKYAVLPIGQNRADCQIAEPRLHIHDAADLLEVVLARGRGHDPDKSVEVRPVVDGIVVFLVPSTTTVVGLEVITPREVIPPRSIARHPIEIATRLQWIVLTNIPVVDGFILNVEAKVVVEGP